MFRLKLDSSIPDVLPREAGVSFSRHAYHWLSLPHTGILALHASLSLSSLHASHSSMPACVSLYLHAHALGRGDWYGRESWELLRLHMQSKRNRWEGYQWKERGKEAKAQSFEGKTEFS